MKINTKFNIGDRVLYYEIENINLYLHSYYTDAIKEMFFKLIQISEIRIRKSKFVYTIGEGVYTTEYDEKDLIPFKRKYVEKVLSNVKGMIQLLFNKDEIFNRIGFRETRWIDYYHPIPEFYYKSQIIDMIMRLKTKEVNL